MSAMSEKEFAKQTKELLEEIGKEEANRLFSYPFCEMEDGFVCFINYYSDIKPPKDFTVIDIGAYQSFQGALFKDCAKYIGVEPAVPLEYRLRQDNAEYYMQTSQEFIRHTLPRLIDEGLDLEKTFAICSGVPDFEATKEVSEVFKYYRIAYPAEETKESYPDDFIQSRKSKPMKDKKKANKQEERE